MAGFLGSNVSLTICKADGKTFQSESLRKYAFQPDIDAGIVRQGWVGLGEMLDYTDFLEADPLEGFVGFSLRIDVRKPSSAFLRLKIAEAVQEEEEKKGARISKARRKEIREEITERVTLKADFVPQIIDCVWHLEKDMLYITSASSKIVDSVCEYMKGTFGVIVERYVPKKSDFLGDILTQENLHVGEYAIWSRGSGSLQLESEEKSVITVLNDGDAVAAALKDGFMPSRLHVAASPDSDTDIELDFTLSADLTIGKLLLPKAEKGADRTAIFLDHAAMCARVGEIVKELGE